MKTLKLAFLSICVEMFLPTGHMFNYFNLFSFWCELWKMNFWDTLKVFKNLKFKTKKNVVT